MSASSGPNNFLYKYQQIKTNATYKENYM